MLYITDIDSESFGLSSSPDSTEVIKAKVYYAVCHKFADTALVSIKNIHRTANIVSSTKIEDITLNSVVYETCWEFVSAFNAMMESEGTTTTTTESPVTSTTTEEATTTTTEEVTTTTTTAGGVPEGAIKFEGTDTYVTFEDGGEEIFVIFET